MGIVVGAILSGTIQLFIDWRNRRTASRIAARVLFSDLFSAMEAYVEAVELKRWWRRGELPLEGWKTYRDGLAAVMNGEKFNEVNAAFQNIEYYEAQRRSDPVEGETLSGDALAKALAMALPAPCWLALNYLEEAGMTWTERRGSSKGSEDEIVAEFSMDPFRVGDGIAAKTSG